LSVLVSYGVTYKIVSQDQYAEVFELVPPQKEFAIYSESRWKRVT